MTKVGKYLKKKRCKTRIEIKKERKVNENKKE